VLHPSHCNTHVPAMPPRTALATPLRAWNCPQCATRAFASTAQRPAVGPEHPYYLHVPIPPQQDAPRRPPVKGSLPVPRDVFEGARGRDKATEEWVHQHTQPRQRATPVKPGSREEWMRKISDQRRRNLREGLASLRVRKTQDQQRRDARTAQRQAERAEQLSAPIQEHDRLTAPSHGLNLAHPPDAPYNVKIAPTVPPPAVLAAHHARKTALVRAHAEAKASARLAHLQTLYTNAQTFIVATSQLDAAIEEEFGTEQNPRRFHAPNDTFRGAHPAENENSVWSYGKPESVQDMLRRANGQTSQNAFADAAAQDRMSVNAKRVGRIAEVLTGGKMGVKDEGRVVRGGEKETWSIENRHC
jgi:hypothetical protein